MAHFISYTFTSAPEHVLKSLRNALPPAAKTPPYVAFSRALRHENAASAWAQAKAAFEPVENVSTVGLIMSWMMPKKDEGDFEEQRPFLVKALLQNKRIVRDTRQMVPTEEIIRVMRSKHFEHLCVIVFIPPP